MNKLCCALLLSLPLLAQADDISKVNGAVRVAAGATAGAVETVNGSVTIGDGATVRSVETVNGSVTVGNRVTAQDVETVNGGISIGEESRVESVETLNGGLRIGAGTQVDGHVSAVNGAISLAKGVDVRGRLSNVNGRIELDAAHVSGGIETTLGSINVGRGSRVKGGILVEKPRRSNWFGKRKRPVIVIGPDAIVEGTLTFEHDVDLYVSDRARIGLVSGATAIKFSGEEPVEK